MAFRDPKAMGCSDLAVSKCHGSWRLRCLTF